MNVAIIGAGSMAKGLCARLTDGGHQVTFYARHEAEQISQELKVKSKPKITSFDQPIVEEVIVAAVPYDELANALTPHKDQLAGKIIVEISNPLDFQTFELKTRPDKSAAEEVAELLPNAKIVKAFNTTFAGTLVEGNVADMPLDVFVAGDDKGAKQTVMQLINDGGMRAIDAGPLSAARALEAFEKLHIAIQDKLGTGYMSAIKIVS